MAEDLRRGMGGLGVLSKKDDGGVSGCRLLVCSQDFFFSSPKEPNLKSSGGCAFKRTESREGQTET